MSSCGFVATVTADEKSGQPDIFVHQTVILKKKKKSLVQIKKDLTCFKCELKICFRQQPFSGLLNRES